MNNLTVQVEYAIWLVFHYCNSQSFYSEFKANLYINPLQYSSESDTIYNTTLIAGIIWMRLCDFSLVLIVYMKMLEKSHTIQQIVPVLVAQSVINKSAQGSKNMAEQTRTQAVQIQNTVIIICIVLFISSNTLARRGMCIRDI